MAADAEAGHSLIGAHLHALRPTLPDSKTGDARSKELRLGIAADPRAAWAPGEAPPLDPDISGQSSGIASALELFAAGRRAA
ncbi:hypothetical protein [Poseidonocella sp. HB161398]|uniref:hypothetical protein n=1 Tax=Poseidonocella sp. HB161398 TaxID=2320855 RepID=UPI0014862AC2|nr:hypothetical protein [Poseidonocella sp. HB161398]